MTTTDRVTTSASPKTGCPVDHHAGPTHPGAPAYPFAAPEALDLGPRYKELRAEAPLSRITLPYGGEAWLAVRHADVKTVLADPRFSRAAVVGADVPRARPEIDMQSASILNMDPPEHTRLRKLVARAFTARRVERFRPRAEEITAEFLAGMRASGAPADLMEHLAVPLPVTIICELLGVPVEDRDVFRAGADAALSTSSRSPEERLQASQEMISYMAGLVARRRAEPTEDLLGALVLARDCEDRLTEAELIGLGVGILIAGHETTMNHIGNFTYELLTGPGAADQLRANLDDVAAAVEELLRHTPLGAGAGFIRIATEDIELGGVTVREGEGVMVAIHSANRDESVFDDADALRLDRAVNPHIGFGHGPHHCLGAQLARMELQVAMGALMREFPELALATAPEDVEWKSGGFVRGPEKLMVTW